MFSAELGLACMELNGERHDTLPVLHYTGCTWEVGHQAIGTNVTIAFKDLLRQLVQARSYILPGVVVLDDVAAVTGNPANVKKPQMNTAAYKNTFPRASGELPIKESAINEVQKHVNGFPDLMKDPVPTKSAGSGQWSVEWQVPPIGPVLPTDAWHSRS